MKRLFPMPWISAFILFIWPLLMADAGLAVLIGAALLAFVLPLLAGRFVPAVSSARRPKVIVALLVTVLIDIVRSNITVARLVLGDVSKLRPVFVEVRCDTSHPYVVTLLASIITMTPGTVSSRVIESRGEENPIIVVHALDCDQPQALIAEIKSRYERPLMEIYQC